MRALPLFAALIASAALLCACGGIGIGQSNYFYDDFDEYTMGGGTVDGAVSALSINWISGSVTVDYHDGDGVILRESTSDETDEKSSMYYRLKDGALTVQFAASGKHEMKVLNILRKDLTVLLPRDTVCTDLSLNLVSAEGRCTVEAERIDCNTVSGGVTLKGTDCDALSVQSVSGKVKAVLSGKLRTAKLDTVSGDLSLTALALGDLKANTVSGDLSLTVQSEPGGMEVNSTSGDFDLFLPSEADLTVKIDSVSGDLESDLPLIKQKDEVYLLGEGGGECRFHSVSGDMYIAHASGREG